MKAISQVYEAVVGLNKSYTDEFLQRVRNYLNSSHEILGQTDLKERSFLSRRCIARARKKVVLDGKNYFWNIHLDPTGDLLEYIFRIKNGESKETAGTFDGKFDEKIKNWKLDAGELSELLNERRYLFQRTFVNT